MLEDQPRILRLAAGHYTKIKARVRKTVKAGRIFGSAMRTTRKQACNYIAAIRVGQNHEIFTLGLARFHIPIKSIVSINLAGLHWPAAGGGKSMSPGIGGRNGFEFPRRIQDGLFVRIIVGDR